VVREHEGTDPLSEVEMTSVGVAHIRAVETARPDRLFADPLAAEFVSASGWSPPDRPPDAVAEAVSSRFRDAIRRSVVVRTRFLDEFVLDACDAGCRQVVLLGAGMDARAYRLSWPAGVRVFELDLADVLAFKERVLGALAARAGCERIAVPSDLAGNWPPALVAAGLRTEEPAAWIAEGLLIYFTDDQNDRLLGRVSELSAPGSRLGLTLGTRGLIERLDEAPSMAELAPVTAMWKSTAPEYPGEWLTRYGWRADVFDAAERAEAYGRPEPVSGEGRSPLGWLVSATRGTP
jgi:methyltransferase (TIGR00027 family)